MNIRKLLVLLIVIALAGCASIGPSSMRRDRFDYMGVVAESWKTQMLLNLVKIRYGDTPVFLDIGQVISGYELEGTLTASGNLADKDWRTAGGALGTFLNLGAGGRYLDRPTITYAPLAGERFARSLMMPLPVSAVLNVLQAGYPADFVFRLAVQSLNGIDNRRVQLRHVRPANPEFYTLIRDLNRIQTSGEVGLRFGTVDREEKLEMIFRPRIDAAVAEAVRDFKNILGLNPTAREFRVRYGVVPADDKEITLLTRSILEVLTDLSSRIEVPEAHVTEHRVGPTPEPDLGAEGPIQDLIRITSSADRPQKAFVATPYRDYWFSIDDQDLGSKRLFTFLMFIFTFVETPGGGAAPIVTIPATR